MKIRFFFFIFLIGSFLFSCRDNQNYIPKPPTYLEISFPKKEYQRFTDSCGYSYNKPNYFEVKLAKGDNKCNRDIDFGDFNGIISLSRLKMEESLDVYVNYALDKVEEHKIMASAIFDSSFIRNEEKVFGTVFELQGNVATPFHFYITDSLSEFVSGVVYFNTRPNYDSIRPVLNFVKEDLYKMISSFEWEETKSE